MSRPSGQIPVKGALQTTNYKLQSPVRPEDQSPVPEALEQTGSDRGYEQTKRPDTGQGALQTTNYKLQKLLTTEITAPAMTSSVVRSIVELFIRFSEKRRFHSKHSEHYNFPLL
ncbi:unnamed protein product [Caenorhabditis brenneri]